MSAFLRLNIDDTQTTIDIEDTSDFPVNGGVVLIESEKISYEAATPQGIVGCTRGYDSTTAVSHLAQVEVELLSEPISNDPPFELKASGAPVDNLTGVKIAPTGTRYTDIDNGQVYLNIGTSDEPTWTPLSTGGSAVPGGPDMALQFNALGVFSGDSHLTYDYTTNKLTHTGTGYTFEFNPDSGELNGVQSINGPVDDDLVVNARPTFDLTLQGTEVNVSATGLINMLPATSVSPTVVLDNTSHTFQVDGAASTLQINSDSPGSALVFNSYDNSHTYFNLTHNADDTAKITGQNDLVLFDIGNPHVVIGSNDFTWDGTSMLQVNGTIKADNVSSFSPSTTTDGGGQGFTTSATFVDTLLTANFAMADASHKVKVSVVSNGWCNAPDDKCLVTIAMDGTNIGTLATIDYTLNNDTVPSVTRMTVAVQGLFSPGDTASHTFTVQYSNNGGGQQVIYNADFGKMIIEEVA